MPYCCVYRRCHSVCRIAVSLSQCVSYCCIPATECAILLYHCHSVRRTAVCSTVVSCVLLLVSMSYRVHCRVSLLYYMYCCLYQLSYRVYCCVCQCRIVCVAVCTTVVRIVVCISIIPYALLCVTLWYRCVYCVCH